eukprot:IDg10006t1
MQVTFQIFVKVARKESFRRAMTMHTHLKFDVFREACPLAECIKIVCEADPRLLRFEVMSTETQGSACDKTGNRSTSVALVEGFETCQGLGVCKFYSALQRDRVKNFKRNFAQPVSEKIDQSLLCVWMWDNIDKETTGNVQHVVVNLNIDSSMQPCLDVQRKLDERRYQMFREPFEPYQQIATRHVAVCRWEGGSK